MNLQFKTTHSVNFKQLEEYPLYTTGLVQLNQQKGSSAIYLCDLMAVVDNLFSPQITQTSQLM